MEEEEEEAPVIEPPTAGADKALDLFKAISATWAATLLLEPSEPDEVRGCLGGTGDRGGGRRPVVLAAELATKDIQRKKRKKREGRQGEWKRRRRREIYA